MNEGQYIATRFANTGVERVRFTLLRLEDVAHSAWVATGEITHHLSRLIARIVIHYEDFPLHRVWHRRGGETLQCLCQRLAAVMCADDDTNVH